MAVTTNRGRTDAAVDPAAHITDIANAEIVFKDGVRYETKERLEPVNGQYREY